MKKHINRNNYINKPFILLLFFLFFLFVLIFIFIPFYLNTKKIKEGFTWSKSNINKFLNYQQSSYPNLQFNMQMVQEQASEQELDYLLKNGYWPWSPQTEEKFLNAISNNTILRVPPQEALNEKKKIYNEKAIQQLLGWNTKEGQFLVYGGIGKSTNEVIKCNLKGDGMSKMNKNKYDFLNRINSSKINNEDIPNEMPGFAFVDKICNPCVALNNDYSCPFTLNIEGNQNISNIWKKNWNLL